MNKEQNFLIKYGLHNFVTFAKKSGRNVFFIKKLKSKSMTDHARHLIEDSFGEAIDIKLVS
jgi:hypothetical protein